MWKIVRLKAGTSKDPIKKQNKKQKQNSFWKHRKERRALFKNLIATWFPGCVYWTNLKSIIKTMFYHFPSRLVTSYKLDHLTHLSCTWNSHWNSAMLTVQRKITFQRPTYIFFSDSSFWYFAWIPTQIHLFFSKHIFGLLPSLFLETIFPFDIQYTTWSTITGYGIESLMGCQEHR